MNPIFLMQVNKTNMTKSELVIMNYTLKNLEKVSDLTINDFADNLKMSKSAISRFCKKIGYSGYSQFKYDIRRHLNEIENEVDEKNSKHTVASIYSNTIKKIDETVSIDIMTKLKSKILESNKIKIFGFSETGLSAQFFSFRLTDHGFDAEAITHPSFFRKKVSLSKKDDILIFFSLSANSDYIKKALQITLENGIPTALVTQNIASKFKDEVDYFLELPFFEDNPDDLLLDSQVILQTFCLTFLNFLENKTQ